MRIIIVGIAFILSGCQSYMSMIDGLNRREIQSCLVYNGAVRIGAMGGGQGALRGVTATGGASIETCKAILGIP